MGVIVIHRVNGNSGLGQGDLVATICIGVGEGHLFNSVPRVEKTM